MAQPMFIGTIALQITFYENVKVLFVDGAPLAIPVCSLCEADSPEP